MPNPITGYIVIRINDDGSPTSETRLFQPEERDRAVMHLATCRECGQDEYQIAVLMDI